MPPPGILLEAMVREIAIGKEKKKRKGKYYSQKTTQAQADIYIHIQGRDPKSTSLEIMNHVHRRNEMGEIKKQKKKKRVEAMNSKALFIPHTTLLFAQR
jgi:hypothetical protein